MTLVMKVGGASGPLYGTLFMALGKELPAEPDRAGGGKGARRTRSPPSRRAASRRSGRRRMLDVLEPVQQAFADGADATALRAIARERGEGDHSDEGDPRPGLVPRRALDRPHGSGRPLERNHDRVRSAMCWSGGHDSTNVGIVIVSHSKDVARGAADMVRQMVGPEVPLAHCGGNPDGGLGTSVERSWRRSRKPGRTRAWRCWSISAGRRPTARWRSRCCRREQRDKVVICNAPIVEGAVMAATEASAGSSLAAVRSTAEELYAGAIVT